MDIPRLGEFDAKVFDFGVECVISFMLSALLVSLLMVPIPTLNDGMTIGDTIDVMVVAFVVVVFDWLEFEASVKELVLSNNSEWGTTFDISRTLLFPMGDWLDNASIVDVDISIGAMLEVTLIGSSWLVWLVIAVVVEEAAAITSSINDSLLSPLIRFSMSRRLTSLRTAF